MRAFAATCLCRALSGVISDVQCRVPALGTRRMCLTFDDGPTQNGTPEIRDVLAEQGVRAMFFLVGVHAKAHPEQVAGLLADGHLIGNHSFTHIDAWRAAARRVAADMDRCRLLLDELAGERVGWVRPPFGRVTPGLLRWSRQRGQRMLLWSMMPPDFEAGATARSIESHLLRRAGAGKIICLHDKDRARRVTAGALRRCLPRLRDAGWEFVLPERTTNVAPVS
jgi:peptidoglycan/xylan/chitin deacetylase (PgdA/CDA1 family)